MIGDAWKELVEKMAVAFPVPPTAYPVGTRIVKYQAEEGDAHTEGSLGKVLGAMCHPDLGMAYFIGWDDMPEVGVLTVGWKIKEVADG